MKVMKLEEPRALEHAIATLQHGGTVAFPTDTVYGIGAAINAPEALVRIYEAKGRDSWRPLPVLLSSPSAISVVSPGIDHRLLNLATNFWPGALTVAVPALPNLPPQIVAPDGTVGVRVPDHSIALTLAQRSGGAIAVTSANLSGRPAARRLSEVDTEIRKGVDIVLDGGELSGTPSTVIDLTRYEDGGTWEILREGAVERGALMDLLDLS